MTDKTEPTTEAGRRLLEAEEGFGIADPIREAILAIEAEALAAEPPALDVERLARALDNGLQLGQPWASDIVPYHDFLMACATDIAAEYARLVREDAAEPPALDVAGIVNSFRYSEPLGRTSEEHRLWERNEETLDAILDAVARHD